MRKPKNYWWEPSWATTIYWFWTIQCLKRRYPLKPLLVLFCLWNLFCMQMILDILDNRKHSYGSKVCHTVDAQGSSKLIILKNCCCIYVLLSDTHFKLCDGCLCRAIFRDNIFSSLLQFLPGIGECPWCHWIKQNLFRTCKCDVIGWICSNGSSLMLLQILRSYSARESIKHGAWLEQSCR